MHIAQLTFARSTRQTDPEAPEAILDVLGFLRMNGQILGREFPLVETAAAFHTVVMLPRPSALDPQHANGFVTQGFAQLAALGVAAPVLQVLGPDPTSAEPCACATPTWFILFTTATLLESPLWCGTCFGPLPLYAVPPTADDEYTELIAWQNDVQACDQLYFNSSTGEQFALDELSRPTSSLAQRSRRLCRTIEAMTSVPTFSTLFVPERTGEAGRHGCPNCGQGWQLARPLHDRFAYKCDRCTLLGLLI